MRLEGRCKDYRLGTSTVRHARRVEALLTQRRDDPALPRQHPVHERLAVSRPSSCQRRVVRLYEKSHPAPIECAVSNAADRGAQRCRHRSHGRAGHDRRHLLSLTIQLRKELRILSKLTGAGEAVPGGELPHEHFVLLSVAIRHLHPVVHRGQICCEGLVRRLQSWGASGARQGEKRDERKAGGGAVSVHVSYALFRENTHLASLHPHSLQLWSESGSPALRTVTRTSQGIATSRSRAALESASAPAGRRRNTQGDRPGEMVTEPLESRLPLEETNETGPDGSGRLSHLPP